MEFFTSPEDLKGWVKTQESPDEAALKIMDIIGKNEEMDIVDTCRAIFEGEQETGVDNASKILFSVLAKHNLTEIKEGKMNDKLKKEAQIMRQPGEYDMPLRICPKLPFSVGKRLISTYNCRHYCLDSVVFDDDPERIYCAEALWRRHVADKFSREWKDKDGKWVGGYINERFQVYKDDGGNQMELANDERTRKPRPHQYSIERRLSEGRGEETYDLVASSNKVVKVASTDAQIEDSKVYQMFSDIVDMKEDGLSDEEIISNVAEHYGESIFTVAKVHKLAVKQAQAHKGILYAYSNSSNVKTAQMQFPRGSTVVTQRDVDVVSLQDGTPTLLKIETPVVKLSNDNNPVFEIVDGPDAGQKFKLANVLDLNDVFGITDGPDGQIQDGAEELGLNEEVNIDNSTTQAGENFPITEV